MNKTLLLALNRYSTIPHSLRSSHASNSAASTITVPLASLYHHYYLDTYGTRPPVQDPVHFEHVQSLMSTKEFRFQGGGLGASITARRHRSNELGQAFFRWFLHDHLSIVYFAHMDEVLGRQLHRGFGGFRLERSDTGDAPDYLCAESVERVYLGEAKGRYSSVSFSNREFQKWRDQFDRVRFLNASGEVQSLKGHIVATRYATERNRSSLKSCLYAEDPKSPGDRPLDRETTALVAGSVVALHYSEIASKLRQPVLASALYTGVPIPEELRITAFAWRLMAGPLAGIRFVGGFFRGSGGDAPSFTVDSNGELKYTQPAPWLLDLPERTFFGVEESIFRQVVELGRGSSEFTSKVERFEPVAQFYSAFSILRDGTALGPLSFFAPSELLEL